MNRPGRQSSPDKGGAVGHDLRAVTGDSVRRRPQRLQGSEGVGERSSPESSSDASGAVIRPPLPLPERRVELVDALYHQNSAVAELLAGMESVCADLDDDTLSGGLWSLQQACLRFDRDLRVRRR